MGLNTLYRSFIIVTFDIWIIKFSSAYMRAKKNWNLMQEVGFITANRDLLWNLLRNALLPLPLWNVCAVIICWCGSPKKITTTIYTVKKMCEKSSINQIIKVIPSLLCSPFLSLSAIIDEMQCTIKRRRVTSEILNMVRRLIEICNLVKCKYIKKPWIS